VIFDGKLVGFR